MVPNVVHNIVHIEQVRKREFPKINHINIGGGFYSEMPEVLKKQLLDQLAMSVFSC